jgi:hypothetical protein
VTDDIVSKIFFAKKVLGKQLALFVQIATNYCQKFDHNFAF